MSIIGSSEIIYHCGSYREYLNFYILIINEKVLVLCGKRLSKFSSNLHDLRLGMSVFRKFIGSIT